MLHHKPPTQNFQGSRIHDQLVQCIFQPLALQKQMALHSGRKSIKTRPNTVLSSTCRNVHTVPLPTTKCSASTAADTHRRRNSRIRGGIYRGFHSFSYFCAAEPEVGKFRIPNWHGLQKRKPFEQITSYIGNSNN